VKNIEFKLPIPIQSVFVIAEAGVNHNGDADLAVELVEAAIDSGADAIKFQTFSADEVVTQDAEKAEYQKRQTGEASQWEMLRELELPRELHFQLKDICEQVGVEFMSTAFDEKSLEFLVKEVGVKRLKIPSGEITNGPFLLEHAQTGLDCIVSTGMANLGEIEEALGVLAFGYLAGSKSPGRNAFREAYRSRQGQDLLKQHVSLLHCTTDYPAAYESLNLRAMDTMASAFELPVGYSDHSIGLAVPLAAVARGACIIEKHFTLDRNLPGPDHSASLNPGELTQMVAGIRAVESALGFSEKMASDGEWANIPIARRSLVADNSIETGESFSSKNLGIKRPGHGISPMEYWDHLGRSAARKYDKDELIGD
jgi:N-acetylneuraminate synthase